MAWRGGEVDVGTFGEESEVEDGPGDLSVVRPDLRCLAIPLGRRTVANTRPNDPRKPQGPEFKLKLDAEWKRLMAIVRTELPATFGHRWQINTQSWLLQSTFRVFEPNPSALPPLFQAIGSSFTAPLVATSSSQRAQLPSHANLSNGSLFMSNRSEAGDPHAKLPQSGMPHGGCKTKKLFGNCNVEASDVNTSTMYC